MCNNGKFHILFLYNVGVTSVLILSICVQTDLHVFIYADEKSDI
jgi:hypothetical protein